MHLTMQASVVPGAATVTPQAPVTFTPLTLINNWTDTQYSTAHAAVANISGIVHLRGDIERTGTNIGPPSPVPFVLPAAFRPATMVYVPVDMCGATNGSLLIKPSGDVIVEAEGGTFSSAECFTSLDGVSFARSASLFTPLKLVNGWTNAPSFTSKAAARVISGIVHLKGAIANGNRTIPFILPAGFRPATVVYVPVDMCEATDGRLIIQPTGVVSVQAGGSIADAKCITSLDGVSFATSASLFTPLKLVNGWTNSPGGTSKAAVRNISGIVQLKGAIRTSGSNPVAFTLPPGFRPARTAFVKVDMCDATNGRLKIQPSGVVVVDDGLDLSNAKCFTSLDGASFAL